MDHSRDSLKDFLAEHAVETDSVPMVMRNLEPLFAHADAGRYRLHTGSDIGLELVGGAIASATGRTAVSVSLTLMSRIGHLTINDEVALWRRLMDGKGDSLGDCLRHEHRTALAERLRDNDVRNQVKLSQRLWERLDSDLWKSLDAAVAGVACEHVSRSAIMAIADSFRTVVYFFVGFAIAGDKQRTARMALLMGLIPKVIPLHDGIREPNRFRAIAY